MSLFDFKRDPANGVLGGVCTGLAKVLETPVWLPRALFLFGLLFLGGTLWVYLILWLLVPAQGTNAASQTPKTGS